MVKINKQLEPSFYFVSRGKHIHLGDDPPAPHDVSCGSRARQKVLTECRAGATARRHKGPIVGRWRMKYTFHANAFVNLRRD